MRLHRLLAFAGLLWATSLVGCPPPFIPDPPFPEPTSADCGQVCEHWRALGCAEAEPSPDGEPCEVVCETFSRYWDLGCMSRVELCAEIESCN